MEAFMQRHPARWQFDFLLLINALACFALVTVYFYSSAIPLYNKTVWKTDIDIYLKLHIPSVSILLPISNQGVNLVDKPDNIGAYVEYNGIRHSFPSQPITQTANFRGSYTAITLDASQLNATDFTTIQDLIHIELDVNYNSSGTTSSSLTTYFELYDSRLSLDTVYACEIANYPRMAAFSTNEYNLVAKHIIDRYSLVVSPSATEECGRTYHALLTDNATPYTAYSWNLESNVPTAADVAASCGVASDGSVDAQCLMALELSFGTHLIHMFESQPGISKLVIWLNAGAITGGIQIFAWFAGILLLRGASR